MNRVNGGGSGGEKFFIMLDQDGNHICGSNFSARGGRVGGFRLIENTTTEEEEVMKCQSCRSCGCSRSGGYVANF